MAVAFLCAVLPAQGETLKTQEFISGNDKLSVTASPQLLNTVDVEALWQQTNTELSSSSSLMGSLSAGGKHALPGWFRDGLARCEAWFARTEGKVGCRDGALYAYWHDTLDQNKVPERREARRLARFTRLTQVTVTENGLEMPESIAESFWHFDVIRDALIVDRISARLRDNSESGFYIRLNDSALFHTGNQSGAASPKTASQKAASRAAGTIVPERESVLSGTGGDWLQRRSSGAQVVLDTKTRTVITGAEQTGVLDSSDGWPKSGLAARALANTAVEAALLARLAVVSSVNALNERITAWPDMAVEITDEKGRVRRVGDYLKLTGGEKSGRQIDIDIELPRFNVPNYHGPYAAVWLSDEHNKLIKSLLLRGDNVRWLKDLRVWWRRVGRFQPDLVDAFAGATRKSKPLDVRWDGTDEQGKPVTTSQLLLNVEIAREDGVRSYLKIPLVSDALGEKAYTVDGEGEIGAISIELR